MRSNHISANVGTHVQSEVQPIGHEHNIEPPAGLNRPKKILIVDDEPRNIKLLAAKLPQKDYEIIKAYDGLKYRQMVWET